MGQLGVVWSVTRRVTALLGKRMFIVLFGLAGAGLGGVSLADDFTDGMALYHDKRYEKAFELIKKAAQAENPDAQYRLSSMYWHGRGVDADYEQAFLWCRRAAFNDHVKAAYALSEMYRKGIIEEDQQQAYYWFRRAAELDRENGHLAMALMYYRGTLVEKNIEKALTWFYQAADEGNVTALTMLGIMYEMGGHVEKDIERAWSLFAEAADRDIEGLTYRDAARQSRAEARYHLAKIIEAGREGVAADPEAALQWYRKAAEDGNAAAKARLDAGNVPVGRE